MGDDEGRLAQLGRLLREFYEAPYRGAVARARREEDDLFMLFVSFFGVLLGPKQSKPNLIEPEET